MKPVLLCSPFRAEDTKKIRQHLAYTRRAMRHAISNDESPLPPHLLYPQVLNDADIEQRAVGMRAGLAWLARAEALVVYADFGVSPGMQDEIALATHLRIPIEFRYIIERKAPQRSSIPK